MSQRRRRLAPTAAQHAELAATLAEMRRRVAAVGSTVTGRVLAKTMDAVVRLDARLHQLNVHMFEMARDAGVTPNPYRLWHPRDERGPAFQFSDDPADGPPIGLRRSRLSPAHHKAIGRALHEVRAGALNLSVRLANEHYPKHATVASKAKAVYRRTGVARSRPRDLFAQEHASRFDARVYDPRRVPPRARSAAPRSARP